MEEVAHDERGKLIALADAIQYSRKLSNFCLAHIRQGLIFSHRIPRINTHFSLVSDHISLWSIGALLGRYGPAARGPRVSASERGTHELLDRSSHMVSPSPSHHRDDR